MKQNIELFSNKTQVLKQFHCIKEHPAFTFKNSELANYLAENGILITNFKYPTYKNMMNRIVITANHTKADLEKLIQILNKKL